MMKRFSVILLFLLTCAPIPCAQAQIGDLEAQPPGSPLPLAISRPNAGAGPTEVTVSLFTIDIETIDDAHQGFTVDFVLDVGWIDERLGEKARQAGGPVRFSLDAVWHPWIQVVNQRRVFQRFPEQVEADMDGNVLYVQRFYGTLASPLDLREFPFDVQSLPIRVASFYQTDEVRLVWNEARTATSDAFTLAGWTQVSTGGEAGDFMVRSKREGGDQAIFSQIEYRLKLERDVRFYYWKVLLPMVLIVFMSWSVCWIDPTQLGPQLGAATTSVLTLIAFLFSLRGVLPTISYLTRIDIFIYSSLTLVFVAYLEALITCYLAAQGREKLARWIDKICRVLLPGTFAVVLWTLLFQV